MNSVTQVAENEELVSAPFFLRGEVLHGTDVIQTSRDLGGLLRRPGYPSTAPCRRAPRCRHC